MNKSIAEITIAITGGGTPARQIVEFWKGNIPWATVKDVKEGMKYLQDTEEHITETGLRSSASNLVTANSLIVCTRMAVGRSVLTTRPTAINQDLKCLKIKPEYDVNFVYYQITNEQNTIEGQAIGSTVKGISVGELKKLSFYCPDNIFQQRKIARILSTIDGQIEKTEAIIAKYQAIKQGMLQDLFTRGIDVRTGQLRPRYEDAPEFYKDSPLGMIPKEWEVVSVQGLSLEIKVGIVIKPTQYYKPEGVPMLRSFNVKAGYITMNDLVFMSEKDNNLQAKSRLCVGDVVSVRTGYPGTTAVVTPSIAGYNCIDIVITKVNPTMLIPEFLADWTNSAFGMKQVFAKQGGNAQQHFNVGEMKKLRIPRVSFPEQQMMVKITHNIREVLSKEVDTLAKLQLLKQGLMQDLLSGKVEVTA